MNFDLDLVESEELRLSKIYQAPYTLHHHRDHLANALNNQNKYTLESLFISYYKKINETRSARVMPLATAADFNFDIKPYIESHAIKFGDYCCITSKRPAALDSRENKSFTSPSIEIIESPAVKNANLTYSTSFNIPHVRAGCYPTSIIKDLSSYNHPSLNIRGGRLTFLENSFVVDSLLVIHDHICGPNYSHWLLDWLPRLIVLMDCGLVASNSIIVIPHKITKFQSEILGYLGFPLSNVIELPARYGFAQIGVNKIVATSLSGENKFRHALNNGSGFLRNLILRKINPPRIDCKIDNIIVNRRGVRKLIFDDNALALLYKYRFTEIFLEDLSFAAQVSIFRNANRIIAAHGAGLANLIFCRSNTRILEIFPENHSTAAFWTLSLLNGLDYTAACAPYASQTGDISDYDRDLVFDHGTLSSWFEQK